MVNKEVEGVQEEHVEVVENTFSLIIKHTLTNMGVLDLFVADL